VLAGVGLYVLARQHNGQAERVGLELARSVANAVDAELRRSISVLETLATSFTLDADDFSGFRERASRVIGPRPEWAAIVLADIDGNTLVDTRALQPVAPIVVDRTSFERVVRTQTPAVGALSQHPDKQWYFAVRAPVLGGGRVRYVISALVRPEAIRDMLVRQQAPDDWVISVVDANGRRVARSRAHEETLGGRLSDTVQAVVDRGGSGEGFGMAYALEGERIFTPYSRLQSSGWVAVLGIPTALVDAAMFRSLTVYSGGVLLSLALAAIGALWVARGISRPIADLRAAAEALGRREAPQAPETSIQEIREVGAALSIAAERLARGEAEREELLRKERHARETAESADRAKDEFMAVLSHELRTPLNAVYGWARMLQGDELRDEALVRRAKDAIVRNADVQVQLIDDLLDLSRITTGKMRLDVRAVDMSAVLQGAIDAVRPAAEAKTIRIQPRLDSRAGQVAGDPARLQQVVWNLLMNAVKFTPAGGLVELELKPKDAHVQIVVRDTGQGIAPQMLPHVFERFRQADSSTTRTHGGLGLGLALVKHIVELHGGIVTAQSGGEGKGANFTVTLPVTAADVAVEPARNVPSNAVKDESPRAIASLDGVRVLVADDDPDALTLAEAILVRAGAHVRTCPSASEALAVLEEWRPDVLVSDIEMPGEDGYSLIRKIRELPVGEGSETPAVALTAYGRPQDRLRSLAGGFNMHVPKPVDPGELTAIVASLAGQPERSRAS
jgi:signal transduction histidine kinase/CheY-like chemotaxis protein